MVFKMLSTLAEFERDVNSERTRNALGHMRRTNRRISAKIPFGYTLAADSATLLLDAGEHLRGGLMSRARLQAFLLILST